MEDNKDYYVQKINELFEKINDIEFYKFVLSLARNIED